MAGGFVHQLQNLVGVEVGNLLVILEFGDIIPATPHVEVLDSFSFRFTPCLDDLRYMFVTSTAYSLGCQSVDRRQAANMGGT